MRRWFPIMVGGQKWTVYLVPATSKLLVIDGEHHFGKCDYQGCKIYISKALEEGAREDALLHELLHALLYVSGAEKVYGCDPKKDEVLVSTLTPVLHRMLMDLGFRFPRFA